ncbi:heme-containing dehydratase [Penicillium bovifimosum]|uniref:Heme-containing dehydratase n=1 Tax=Penicillium bovifimosum TaxID=126998 RepID=A0A9W9L8C8_9EURO|nr:heme-containing dehydratase [Penicillium bovifimosum]KAJ5143955.1 heme-containing dehydratase [Penicillium bovifimosum]
MWSAKLADKPFVYSIFGIQYPTGNPTSVQEALTEEFDSLISGHGTHIERLIQDGCATPSAGKSHVWIAYWTSSEEYQKWWTRDDVSQFWASLPSDAGMWREVLTPSPRRSQYGANKNEPSGLGNLGERFDIGRKSGYWGCYRHRLADHTSDEMVSSAKQDLEPRRPLSKLSAGISSPEIRPGRVHMTHFPNNICFVVEGQDHSAITTEEKKLWVENFDESVSRWMKDLMEAGPESGILDRRMCYERDSGLFLEGEPQALRYNKKVQLFYFKDLRHFEKIGRQNKGHVDLRKRFLEAYGSDGHMMNGNLSLWVETTVLKADEMDCEYVGCVDGTGFMAFSSDLDNFA